MQATRWLGWLPRPSPDLALSRRKAPAIADPRRARGRSLTVFSAWAIVRLAVRDREPAFAPEAPIMKPDLESYRQTLLALRTRLKGDVSHLAGEALHSTGGEGSGGLSNA